MFQIFKAREAARKQAEREKYLNALVDKEIARRSAAKIKAEEEAKEAQAAKEAEKAAKEAAKAAKEAERMEDRVFKYSRKLSLAIDDLAFCEEQHKRLQDLLKFEKLEMEASSYGGKEWAKHQRKVVALENQCRTIQRKIDNAKMDITFCEQRLPAGY